MKRGDFVDIAPGYDWYGAKIHCGVYLKDLDNNMVQVYIHVIPDLPVLEVKKEDCTVIGHHPAYK